MSRSHRKHFWFPTEGDKRNKNWFNRRTRHQKHIGCGGDFKKKNDSRRIHSFFIYYRDEEAFVQDNLGYGDSEQELRKIWRTHFLSK